MHHFEIAKIKKEEIKNKLNEAEENYKKVFAKFEEENYKKVFAKFEEEKNIRENEYNEKKYLLNSRISKYEDAILIKNFIKFIAV